uniref:DUF2192 domain-containing protein n=1 Tax=Thermosphaera aggregans TaxID=54254 RepID=A0A7C2FNB6_9CREN
MRERSPYKRRIQIAVSILSELTKKTGELSRPHVVEILRKTYEKQGLQPIRGKALPQDIYDKEMATIYVVGKHGLNLHEEYPELFEKIFYLEESYEKAVESVLKGDFETARNILKEVSSTGVIDSNTVARMLRIPLTKLVLGFSKEEEFANILRKTIEAFPEEEATVLKYVKFYVAFKLAEMIFRGEVKSREYKEALKKALAIRIGFPRATPSDDYVKAIAESVFELKEQDLKDVLKKPSEVGDTTSTEKSS